MKTCVLTPTFKGHFHCLKKYLKSFCQQVKDKENCEIIFIVSRKEHKELANILSGYPAAQTRIIDFEDILNHFGISESPDELLQKYGKFSFQALKKFYGMLYIKEYSRFLVLDSESMWIYPTNMAELTESFFSDPKIFYTDNTLRQSVSPTNAAATRNINAVLRSKQNKWFVEQFLRFWDSRILQDLIVKYGSPLDMVKQIEGLEKQENIKMGLFESVLYDQFIFENNQKYNYKLIDLDQELKKYLTTDALKKYRNDFFARHGGSAGLTEFFMLYLNQDNINGFVKLCKAIPLNILRCDDPMLQNTEWETVLIEAVKPNILTCSQDHCFGLNKGLYHTYNYQKLQKHLNKLYAPRKNFVERFSQVGSIVFYSVKTLIDITRNTYKKIYNRQYLK